MPTTGWRRRYDDNERLILGLLGVAAFLLAWELGSRAGLVNRAFFGRPTGILEAGLIEIQTPRFYDDLFASYDSVFRNDPPPAS